MPIICSTMQLSLCCKKLCCSRQKFVMKIKFSGASHSIRKIKFNFWHFHKKPERCIIRFNADWNWLRNNFSNQFIIFLSLSLSLPRWKREMFNDARGDKLLVSWHRKYLRNQTSNSIRTCDISQSMLSFIKKVMTLSRSKDRNFNSDSFHRTLSSLSLTTK